MNGCKNKGQGVGAREPAQVRCKGNKRGAGASMNKDPGAQEGYKRVRGGGGRGVETSTSRYEGSAL